MTAIQNISNGEQLSSVRNKINSNFQNIKTDLEKLTWFFDYNDLATQTTPINVPANTDTFLTNDELWAFTIKTYAPAWVTDVWNKTTNAFDFSQLSLGNMIDIRVDFVITTTSANQIVDLDLNLAIGGSNPYTIHFGTRQFKTAGTYQFTLNNWIYMWSNDTKNNPAKLKVRSDGTATVKVNGWACRITRQAK